MNETIKIKPDHKLLSFPVIFFIGSIMLLLAVLGKIYFHHLFDAVSLALKTMTVIAPISAGGITVQQGIAEFSGKTMPIVKTGTYISTYGSLLFLFVASPILFIFLKKKINDDTLEGTKSSSLVRIGYFINFAILIIIPAITLASAIASNSLLSEFKKMNTESKYRDDVTNEFSSIAFKAQQYFILPVEEGGGGRSFLKERKPVSLSDLGFEERTSLGRYILYQQKSDTILYLHFTGNRIGTIHTSYNPEINHVVEYDVIITPLKSKMNMNY